MKEWYGMKSIKIKGQQDFYFFERVILRNFNSLFLKQFKKYSNLKAITSVETLIVDTDVKSKES